MELTLTAGWWIEFCTLLARVTGLYITICFTTMLESTHFQKCIYIKDVLYNAMKCIMEWTCWFLWSWQSRSLRLCVRNIFTVYV